MENRKLQKRLLSLLGKEKDKDQNAKERNEIGQFRAAIIHHLAGEDYELNQVFPEYFAHTEREAHNGAIVYEMQQLRETVRALVQQSHSEICTDCHKPVGFIEHVDIVSGKLQCHDCWCKLRAGR